MSRNLSQKGSYEVLSVERISREEYGLCRGDVCKRIRRWFERLSRR
jgi:hypothetical protein